MVDRSQWKGWGLELNDDDFARAVAALAVWRTDRDRPLKEALRDARWGRSVEVDPFPPAADDPRELRDAWVNVFGAGEEHIGPRFLVLAAEPVYSLAYAELLSLPAVGAMSCYVSSELEEPNIVWNFPLRIGLLPGFRPAEARAIVDRVHWQHLIEIVELSVTARECEVLLLPANMRAAAAALLASRVSVRADCVVVAGTRDDEALGAARLVDVIRLACHASVLVIANVPREERPDWFNEVIREFSHDLSLDVAMFRASPQRPPLIVGSPRLIEQSQLGKHLDVFNRHMARAIDWAEAGQEFSYQSESAGATDIVRIKEAVPPELREARLSGDEEPKERHVIARTTSKAENVTTLQRGREYQAWVRVGFPKKDEAVAREQLALPYSESGHELSIVFCELPHEEGAEVQQPQTRDVFLPPHAESPEVLFYFRTREDANRYEARVIVLHQNRVLQTLTYGAPLDGESRIALEQELDVYPLDQLGGRERFDAAIVLNRAPLLMQPCIVVNGKAKYLPPIDEASIRKISSLLDPILLSKALPKKLSDAKLTRLLLQLANHGHLMWSALAIGSMGAELAKAGRIQVVAAKPGEFLPVEIFYPRDAPEHDAICRHGETILGGGAAARCESAKAADQICPVEFWGLNRVIEHIAFADAKTFKAARSRKATPMFRRAIFAVSKTVRKKDVYALAATLQDVTGAAQVSQAMSWDEWETLVQNEEPSLLVLLPHVDTDHRIAMPGLEINGEIRAISLMRPTHVRKEGSAEQPIVLLLGCSTNLADIALQNAVERFRVCHAGVVLGTISTILGRHAASFSIALLKALKDQSGKGRKFGDVLLGVKRRRVAAGDPFALSLAAYGDSEIRV